MNNLKNKDGRLRRHPREFGLPKAFNYILTKCGRI